MTGNDDAMRTIVDLPQNQVEGLDRLCRQQQISRAEAVRRAVGKLLEEQERAGRDDAFGTWAHKRIDGRKFIDRLRAEWSK